MLSLLHHQNLVNLIGYCADGEQRLLVFEFMPRGSLEDHLLDLEPDRRPLDWFTRMRIAQGAAKGLEYLHTYVNPPVIYRDLKSANILLDDQFNPKLSDFGLAKLGLVGDNKVNGSSRVMGTYGYCAPEYIRTGQLTMQSDVYSFGVVLLELITGRKVIDPTRPNHEQNLVAWAQPIFRDPRRFHEMADPLLNNEFPERGLNQAVAIAAMCLQDEPATRPLITDVVTTLDFLCVAPKAEEASNSCTHPNETETGGGGKGSGSQHKGIIGHELVGCSEYTNGNKTSLGHDHNNDESGSDRDSSGCRTENLDLRDGTGGRNFEDCFSEDDDDQLGGTSTSSAHQSSARNSETHEDDRRDHWDHTSAEDGVYTAVHDKCSLDSDEKKINDSDCMNKGDNRRSSSGKDRRSVSSDCFSL